MFRSTLRPERNGAWLWILVPSLILGAVEVWAQETAPVTVEVVFLGEEVEGESVFGAGGGSNAPVSASARTGVYVLQELVLAPIGTRTEVEAMRERPPRAGLGQPRVFGATVRYERVDFDNLEGVDLDGNTYLTNVQAVWGLNNFEYGLLVPYEYLDLEDVNAHRIGALAFGKYTFRVAGPMSLDVLVNGNYMYTTIDDSDIDDVNTFGCGISSALAWDKEAFVLRAVTSYQFNADDSDSKNDKQHLLKVGADVGVRVGRNAVVTPFGIWTYDASDYDDTVGNADDNYFELGLEAGWSASVAWRLHGGYKKVVGFDDFDSDMVFLGALRTF